MSIATARAGDLSVEAQARYAFIADLLLRDCPPPATIVELGAAPGDQIAALAKRGYHATALDIGVASDEWADGSEGRMRSLLQGADVALVEWNLERVPYPLPDAAFDAVIMTEVYEHLRDYPMTSLHEVRRILKPGGWFYFTTPNAAYLINRLRLLAGRNVATPLRDWIAGIPFARHAREYTFAEARALMHGANLTVVRATSRHFHVQSGRSHAGAVLAKRIVDRAARARPQLGPSIIITARRPG